MGNKLGKVLCVGKSVKADDDEKFFTPTSQLSGSLDDPFEPDATFVCDICVERKSLKDSFDVQRCAHFYCTQCVISFIASMLDNNLTKIKCPVTNCGGVLEPEYCRSILPAQVFDRWGKALCEAALPGSEKFYCPYKDCSALLLIGDGRGGAIRDSSCPFCERVFCVQCKVAWHSGMDCAKFQRLRKKDEDALFEDLAKRKKWRKCPNCNRFVEKSTGCLYIKCRCGKAFCYDCGGALPSTTHYCFKCRR